MKVLSFLGTGIYEETTYIKHDDPTRGHKTTLFPKAIAALYEPSEIVVFATPSVKEQKNGYLSDLQDSLGSQLLIKDIPNGNSEAELWEIFQTCADAVDEKDEIILDITHAFRSLPLLTFIVAAYLREVKQVALKHIIYGAFQAKDESTNQTPIFDLTPFVELLDWTNAVAIFQRTGDARDIAKLGLPNSIVRSLTSISAALLTSRTLEAQQAISSFVNMDLDRPELLSRQPLPFQILGERLKQNYREIGVREPRNDPKLSLEAQLAQIKWYVDNQHVLHAVTLMREWIVSWECLRSNQENWLDSETREAAEKSLNEREKTESFESNRPAISLWRKCIGLRNDIAHCGMRPDPRRAHTAIQEIENLFGEFEAFVAKNLDSF